MAKQDFCLPDGHYLLNHSVGRPLKSAEASFRQQFFQPWQTLPAEPWDQWLSIIDDFVQGLAHLFGGDKYDFCPQVNVSSALTKLLTAMPMPAQGKLTILMAEQDFPSLGFVFQKVLPEKLTIRFIPKNENLASADSWDRYLTPDVDIALITHAYSNTGIAAPLTSILPIARQRNILTILDVAQSAGVLPMNLSKLAPDAMIGSCVKWLCGGPGSGYLWLSTALNQQCKPRDVGWFSHQNPFEFDIHHFEYHQTMLKFWGGTPSITPYALSSNSIKYFTNLGIDNVRKHNLELQNSIIAAMHNFVKSPIETEGRNGSVILHFGDKQADILTGLQKHKVIVDERYLGIRVSPHIYNDQQDIDAIINAVSSYA